MEWHAMPSEGGHSGVAHAVSHNYDELEVGDLDVATYRVCVAAQ